MSMFDNSSLKNNSTENMNQCYELDKPTIINKFINELSHLIIEPHHPKRWNSFITFVENLLPNEILHQCLNHLSQIESHKQQEEILKFKAETAEALLQIGIEITSLAPLRDILMMITDKAREIFKTEIAYIAMLDNLKKEIEVCITSGTTPEMIRLRQKVGHGIGGLITKIKKPIIVGDYLNDLRRDPDVSKVIDQEGIRSLIAAPLLVENNLIGVLYVANRTPNSLNENQATLLMTLSYQAAIAIDNARLYENELRISKINRQITQVAFNLNKFNTENGLVEILNTLADLISQPILMLDSTKKTIYKHIPSREDSSEHAKTDLHINKNLIFSDHKQIIDAIGTNYQENKIFNIHIENILYAVKPIFLNNEIVGYLIISQIEKPLNDIDIIAIEQAANVIALIISKERTSVEVELRLHQDYLSDLLYGSESNETLKRRGKYLGMNFQFPSRIIVISPVVENKSNLMVKYKHFSLNSILSKLRYFLDTSMFPLSMVQNNKLVLVSRTEHQKLTNITNQFIETFLKHTNNLQFVAGMSKDCVEPSDYKKGYLEAQKAADFAKEMKKYGDVIPFDALGVIGLLFESSNLSAIKSFCKSTLGELLIYDQKNGTDLLKTLQAYLDHESEIQSTSEYLHVHYNTLRYRLKRIQDITNINLESPQERLNVRLALAALRMAIPEEEENIKEE